MKCVYKIISETAELISMEYNIFRDIYYEIGYFLFYNPIPKDWMKIDF